MSCVMSYVCAHPVVPSVHISISPPLRPPPRAHAGTHTLSPTLAPSLDPSLPCRTLTCLLAYLLASSLAPLLPCFLFRLDRSLDRPSQGAGVRHPATCDRAVTLQCAGNGHLTNGQTPPFLLPLLSSLGSIDNLFRG